MAGEVIGFVEDTTRARRRCGGEVAFDAGGFGDHLCPVRSGSPPTISSMMATKECPGVPHILHVRRWAVRVEEGKDHGAAGKVTVRSRRRCGLKVHLGMPCGPDGKPRPTAETGVLLSTPIDPPLQPA